LPKHSKALAKYSDIRFSTLSLTDGKTYLSNAFQNEYRKSKLYRTKNLRRGLYRH
jgi:hypothetical protein